MEKIYPKWAISLPSLRILLSATILQKSVNYTENVVQYISSGYAAYMVHSAKLFFLLSNCLPFSNDENSQLTWPCRCSQNVGEKMVMVACGWRHTICVSSSGSLYTYGWSKYGQLGHGDFEDHLIPHKVEALQNNFVSQRCLFACETGGHVIQNLDVSNADQKTGQKAQ
ncbi:Regulator of chromosome condensation, RCC1 [Dillenia turbinata]|uniref:Regulator of chromosome condensation, RCC1 n=1 Tax=Dillenia turbinata TaxID=194707 RepID=A0AAN8UX46_9MAGN